VPQARSHRLYSLFRDLKTRPFLFVQPGGNAGDHLIYRGAEKVAELAGVDYRSIPAEEFPAASFSADTVVYVHGGGGFVPWWSQRSVHALAHALRHHEGTVVLGPSTVSLDRGYLDDALGAPIAEMRAEALHIFARERISLAELERFAAPRVQIALDHDTALNLTRDDLVRLMERNGGRPGYAMYAIREDRESPAQRHRPNPFGVWLDPGRVCRDFGVWLRVHVQAGRIVTNRTHSSIAGAIAGVPTTILANSYHKNRGIWEYSLREMGVEWGEVVDGGAGARSVLALPIAGRVLRNHRVRRVINAWRGCEY
jgi:exopolysaccharide biosynthesis predicted pyruvyltransferase EpsI